MKNQPTQDNRAWLPGERVAHYVMLDMRGTVVGEDPDEPGKFLVDWDDHGVSSFSFYPGAFHVEAEVDLYLATGGDPL